MKSYKQLITLQTFEERLEYLKCFNNVSDMTFGFDRYLNQKLYRSEEWKQLRQQIILRDNGCDLGILGYEIYEKPIIHHINPITIDDIKNNNPIVFDPDNLITTCLFTHNLIHYGTNNVNKYELKERTKDDTCLWR